MSQEFTFENIDETRNYFLKEKGVYNSKLHLQF